MGAGGAAQEGAGRRGSPLVHQGALLAAVHYAGRLLCQQVQAALGPPHLHSKLSGLFVLYSSCLAGRSGAAIHWCGCSPRCTPRELSEQRLLLLHLAVVLTHTSCRPIQRFWVLETVARIPYFAYISILHLYESLGFWRAGADLRRVHFAEEWNELHHLQIMESLGGEATTCCPAAHTHAARSALAAAVQS